MTTILTQGQRSELQAMGLTDRQAKEAEVRLALMLQGAIPDGGSTADVGAVRMDRLWMDAVVQTLDAHTLDEGRS